MPSPLINWNSEPDSDRHVSRNLREKSEKNHRHATCGMKQKVTTQHSRDRARSAQDSESAYCSCSLAKARSRKHVGQRRDHAADQVEDEVPDMAQTIFDVVAKDPKEEHVAEDVRDAAVHEHRSEQREVNRKRRFAETRYQHSLAA